MIDNSTPSCDANTPGTALITGASSGLGKSYCRMLAAKGYRLVLVARREPLLVELGAELVEEFGIEVEFLIVDLADDTQTKQLCEYITQIDDLEYLINNAGFGTAGMMADVDIEPHVAMIQVHVTAMVRLCHAALQVMKHRKSGRIINVASLAAFLTSTGSASYCASKAHMLSFSKSLAAETRKLGISVQALCPGFIYTGFHDTQEMANFSRSQIPKHMWMTPDYVAEYSLRQIERKGLKPRGVVCVPNWKYRLILAVVRMPILGPMLIASQEHKMDRLEK